MKNEILTCFILLSILSVSGQVTNDFPDNGNVGIGTVNPDYKLEVNEGDIGLRGYNTSRWIRFIERYHRGAFLNYDGDTNILSIGVHESDDAQISNDNKVINIPRSTGYVGIGTLNPEYKLELNEGDVGLKGFNTSRYIRFSEINYRGAYINYDGSSNVLHIGVHEDDNKNISNDIKVISIPRNTGNVGIGVEDPGLWKLAVKGKIRAEEIKVETGWADYVFKEGYNLPTLEEVEKYIKERGHLINIPSAKEVEANGVELGEMNKLLLEKIEELTLYTLQQQKEINKYQKDMVLLNKKLEAMEQSINNLKE